MRFALIVLVLAACGGSSRPAVEHPVPSLTGARIRGGGLGAILVSADLEVRNPNRFAVELVGIDWELSLAGSEPVRGRSRTSVTIAAGQVEPVDLMMRLPPVAAAPLAARLAGGEASLRASGILYFASERGELAMPFALAGTAR